MGDLQPSAAVLLSSPASLCVYIYVCVCGRGHRTIPLLSMLYILVTLPSFRRHLYSSFYVSVCVNVDSSCDNSETKVIFKETVMQRGCETAQPDRSVFEMSLLYRVLYVPARRDLSRTSHMNLKHALSAIHLPQNVMLHDRKKQTKKRTEQLNAAELTTRDRLIEYR